LPYTHWLTRLHVGSIVASLYSTLGPIATGSLFAILQSAEAGGLGLASLNIFVQANAAILIGGAIGDAVIKITYHAGLARAEDFHGIRGKMIAAETAAGFHGVGELGRTGEGGLLRR
jgi:hypothetical protein